MNQSVCLTETVALKLLASILQYWPTTSKVGVSGMVAEVEPSDQ